MLEEVKGGVRSAGVLAGLVAMSFAILIAFLAGQAGIPFPPAALGQAVVEALPGTISIPLIGLLQFWAKRLLVLGVIALYLLVGGAAGAAAGSPMRSRSLLALASAPWVATVVLAQLLAGAKVDLGGALLGSAIGAGAFFAALAFLLSAERVATPAALSRRRAFLWAIGASAIVAVAGVVVGGLSRAATKIEPVAISVRKLLRNEPVPAADPAFEKIGLLTPRITANRDHYLVDTALIKPRVDVAAWRLEIAGAVDRPYTIGYDELLGLGTVERPHTLECISNEIGGDLTSTAVWAGVPMKDLLERAGVRPDAYDVRLTSVDGYTDSIRIAKALDPDTLVAYLMNGFTLPEEHGYPARALIPGIYGMKNVKWLQRIEPVTFDYKGYWEERGWSDIAGYNTHTRIDAPPSRVDRAADGTVAVAGIAFAGQRGISRVEVSTDGGATWNEAELEAPPGRLTWLRWRYLWRPQPGRFRIVARSTDGRASLQTAVERPPFPDGSTGWHHVDVSVIS